MTITAGAKATTTTKLTLGDQISLTVPVGAEVKILNLAHSKVGGPRDLAYVAYRRSCGYAWISTLVPVA